MQGIRIQTIADLATYTDSQAIIEWSIVEINVGVIIACIPTFRPLLRGVGRKITSSGNTKLSSLGRRSKGLSTLKSKKMDRWSGSRTGVLPSKRDAVSKVQEEDEVELWDGWNNQRSQHLRASAHVHAESARVAESVLTESVKDKGQITISHEIRVQYGRGDSIG